MLEPTAMLVPVILAGGAGERLWPVSRKGRPKPFMKLADGQSLLHKTYVRALALNAQSPAGAGTADPERALITVTNRDYYFMCKDELAQSVGTGSTPRAAFLLEHNGRNTAPAVALAAHYAQHTHGPEALLLVLPADHLIADQPRFALAVAQAVSLAQRDWLVTFGIVPSSPETGFGYIESGLPLHTGQRVQRFVEKPSAEQAQAYLDAGNFYWNSGMFCFKARVLLEQLACHAPAVAAQAQQCWAAIKPERPVSNTHSPLGAESIEIPAAAFAAMPNISLDYALMEHSDRVAVVAAEIGWSDIGSWNAVQALVAPDADNNRCIGEGVFVRSTNTFIQSEDRLVATVGVDNLMVIDTPDALLVAHPAHAQEVKQIVAQLKRNGHASHKLHRTVTRPWGSYTVLEQGPNFKIKRLEVRPGASLSLQMHHHRSEHWVIVSGTAKVQVGEQQHLLSSNQSTYISAGQLHRLENPGLTDLVVIEVQSGSYLSEDDIVRFQDQYGRV